MKRDQPKLGHRRWVSSGEVPVILFVVFGVLALVAAGVLAAREAGAIDWPPFSDSTDLLPGVGIAVAIAVLMFAMAAAGPVGLLVMLGTYAVGVAAVVLARGAGVFEIAGSTDVRPAAGIAAGLGAFLYIAAISLLVQSRRIRRVKEAMSSSRSSPMQSLQPYSPTLQQSTADVTALPPAPPFTHQIIKARKLPKPRSKLRRITGEANVIGRPPIRILHLWVFESPTRLANYLGSAWREFGYVHLLRSAESVSRKEIAAAERAGGIENLVLATIDEVDQAISGFVYLPGQKRMKGFGAVGFRGAGTWDRYGGYSVNSLLCHNDVWQYALSRVLSTVDAVTMDLSGYTHQNRGSRYEIQTLFDQIPIDRVVWLTDPQTDVSYLVEQMRDAWTRLALNSPNRSGDPGPVRLVKTDFVRRTTTRQGDVERTTETLQSTRRDARRIATHLVSTVQRSR